MAVSVMSNSPTCNTSSPSVPNQHQGQQTTPVVAVVSAVAEAAETDPFKLPPLYNAINPEALDDLVNSGRSSDLKSISFEYAGYDVVVSGTGDVQVIPATE